MRSNALLFLFFPALLLAQETPPPSAPAPMPEFGHSMTSEVFNEGPRQAAVLIGGTGNISFPVTTTSPEAQKFFNQGIGQLHGFWDFEAERSFRQAAALDPNCAMAYWGMTMANFDNLKRAKGFIVEAAMRRVHGLSKREEKWIDALVLYYKEEKKDSKERLRNYVRDLENIVLDYPDDVEAKAFLMRQIYYNNGKGLAISSHLTANLLLDQIFALQPDHPSHHYRIHLWDREKPARALASAAACGPSSPSIAHMWHMPGHIYSRLNRYEDAVYQQEASARIDHAHMIRFRIIPDQIHNFAHNNEWLIRNLNFLGRVEDAVSLSENMIELPRLPKFKKDTETYSHDDGSWSFGRTRLRDTLMTFEEWEQILQLGQTQYLRPGGDAINETEWQRLMAVAAFQSGNQKRAAEAQAALTAALTEAKEKQSKAAKDAEAKAIAEKKPEADVKKAVEAANRSLSGEISPREKALEELKVYADIFGPTPNAEAAAKGLEASKSIEPITKARLYLQLGDFAKAEKLATEKVKVAKNEVQPLTLQVAALWGLGKKDAALTAFEALRTAASSADLESPLFARLAPVLAEQKLTGDWRIAQKPATDLGERPPLDKLGPFRWQAPMAPGFALKDATGKPVSLESYRGKPVVVIFYLGKGCTHCMEQLNSFDPYREKFLAAGIEMVAISTDTPEGLGETYRKSTGQEKNPFPFPLLSDASQDTFRAYRAYDDFEKMPLHATMLIDAVGRIRWQNISFDPFVRPAFLLEESLRLLSFKDS